MRALALVLAMTVFGLNTGFILALARLQSSGYKAWQQNGPAALPSHPYDLDGAILLGLLVTLVFTIAGVAVAALVQFGPLQGQSIPT